jgi:Domain of Unknown Function (DUF1080)
MKLLTFLWALLPALSLNAAELNQLSDAEKAAGWKLLFNGKDLTGWHVYGKKDLPTKGWSVEDGLLHKLPKIRGGDICSDEQFEDYDFSWEWKVAPGANNGVKYLVDETRKAGPGHEYQMIDDKEGHDIAAPKHKTASFYDVLPPSEDKKVKPAGEWNASRIFIDGKHVEHWLNGAKVLEFELGSDEVKKAVANSKFKNVPGFGDKLKGPILLTDHGDEAWFRNVKIRRLE